MASYYARIYCNGVHVRTFGGTKSEVESEWRQYCTMVPRRPGYLAKYSASQVPSSIKHTSPYYEFSVEIVKKNFSGNRRVVYSGFSPFILVQKSQLRNEDYIVFDRNILKNQNGASVLEELYNENIKPYIPEAINQVMYNG